MNNIENTLNNIEKLLTKVIEELQGIKKSIDEFEHHQISFNVTEKSVKKIEDNDDWENECENIFDEENDAERNSYDPNDLTNSSSKDEHINFIKDEIDSIIWKYDNDYTIDINDVQLAEKIYLEYLPLASEDYPEISSKELKNIITQRIIANHGNQY